MDRPRLDVNETKTISIDEFCSGVWHAMTEHQDLAAQRRSGHGKVHLPGGVPQKRANRNFPF